MNPTKIDWCDRTWNSVTGCFNTCPYCYARNIARRFGGADITDYSRAVPSINGVFGNGKLHELNEPVIDTSTRRIAPYPFDFDPTFHKYRLNEPSQIKKPQNIFVCSMADLFGDWVPDEWIEKVFEACMAAPQHRYLFLTKNPERYEILKKQEKLPEKDNFLFGSTITNNLNGKFWFGLGYKSFVSIEPLMSDFNKCDIEALCYTDWVIIGAETGNRKNKIIPKKEWIENIVNYCKEKNVPVFMKNNLAKEVWRKDKKTGEMILVQPKIWDEPLIQKFPWEINESVY